MLKNYVKLCEINNIPKNPKFNIRMYNVVIKNNTRFVIRMNLLMKDLFNDKYYEYELYLFDGETEFNLTLSSTLIITYTQGTHRIYEPLFKCLHEYTITNKCIKIIFVNYKSSTFKMFRYLQTENRKPFVLKSKIHSGDSGLAIINYEHDAIIDD